jgi:ArsR family metal-binding transcriptional regulator
MKLTSSQLRKIIAEEVSKVLNEGDDTLTPGRLALGSLADISEIEKAKAALESLRMNIKQNAIEEGNNSEEAEDFARDGLAEMFKEYM